MDVSVREAREKFSQLLDAVERGEEIHITRNGKRVARLMQPYIGFDKARLAELAAKAAKTRVKGEPMSQAVIRARREGERF